MKYFIYGYLMDSCDNIRCTCVAGVNEIGTIYNMRGGLDYMRNVELYPCLRYPSFEALQQEDCELYSGKYSNVTFKPCTPSPVAI